MYPKMYVKWKCEREVNGELNMQKNNDEETILKEAWKKPTILEEEIQELYLVSKICCQ